MSSKFEASKKFVFDWKVSFKVLTKFDTNLGHFEWTILNKMKPRDIFMLKNAIFLALIQCTTHFEPKYTYTIAELGNVLHKVANYYSLVQNSTVLNLNQWLNMNIEQKILLILSFFWWTILVYFLSQISNSSSKFWFWSFQIWIKKC